MSTTEVPRATSAPANETALTAVNRSVQFGDRVRAFLNGG